MAIVFPNAFDQFSAVLVDPLGNLHQFVPRMDAVRLGANDAECRPEFPSHHGADGVVGDTVGDGGSAPLCTATGKKRLHSSTKLS